MKEQTLELKKPNRVDQNELRDIWVKVRNLKGIFFPPNISGMGSKLESLKPRVNAGELLMKNSGNVGMFRGSQMPVFCF